jgi:hypothetical protein
MKYVLPVILFHELYNLVKVKNINFTLFSQALC